MSRRDISTRSTTLGIGVAILLTTLANASAQAATLSVDADGDTPGVQSLHSVDPADEWTVEIRVDGVATIDELAGYEFDLDYDPAVIELISVSAGDFLPNPRLVLETDSAPPDANLTVLGSGGSASGDGLLGQLSFRALAPGTSRLRLGDVRLARDAGGALVPDLATHADVEVVPEPGTVALSIGALAILASFSRRRRRVGRVPRWADGPASMLCAIAALLLSGSPANAQAAKELDVVEDGMIDILDVTKVDGCIGEDPATNAECERADVDGDGDIDIADRDAVIAALGELTGAPLYFAEDLFDCERDGYPCALGETSLAVVQRIDELLAESKTRLESGDSLEDLEAYLIGLPDVNECYRSGHTLVCRPDGGPPLSIHNGAEARKCPGIDPTAPLPFVPSPGEFVSIDEPIGYRVVGRDRDSDGRHDIEKKAKILAPYLHSFGTSDSAVAVNEALDDPAFDDYHGRIDFKADDEITLEDYFDWEDHEVVFVSTHGGEIKAEKERNATRMGRQLIVLLSHSATFDGPAAMRSCLEAATKLSTPGFPAAPGREIGCGLDNDKEQPGDPDDWRFSVTASSRFFRLAYPTALEDTLIWFDACRSYRTQGFRRELAGRHSVFFGWDDYVCSSTSRRAAVEVFANAAGRGLRSSRAWQIACQDPGVCVDPTATPDNTKQAELVFDFDGVDQRVREVLTILDPETLEEADHESLVKGFVGTLGDGLPADGPRFRFEIEGFEPADLVVQNDPQEFLRRTTFLSMDRDGEDQGADLPLSDQFMEPVGAPSEYRWRNTEPLFPLAFDEDLNVGDQLIVTPKLRFPPSEPDPPVNPGVEIGHSYDADFDYTLEACSFSASVTGSAAGTYVGTVAQVQLGSEWALSANQPFNPNNPLQFPFTLDVQATRAGDLPGALQSVGVLIPSFPPRSFSWDSGSSDPAPSFSAVPDGNGRYTGSLNATLRDAMDQAIQVSFTYDADLLTPENQLGICIR